jgi:hypothetical protein
MAMFHGNCPHGISAMYQAIIPQSVAQKTNVPNNHPTNRGETMAAQFSSQGQPEKGPKKEMFPIPLACSLAVEQQAETTSRKGSALSGHDYATAAQKSKKTSGLN